MSRCESLMRPILPDDVVAHGVSGTTRRGSQSVASKAPSRGPPRACEGWGGRGPSSDAPEAVDLPLELRALLRVADAEAFGGGQAQDADLALVGVVLHVAGGLADVVHGVGLGQRGVDEALVDEPVGLPRLLVVGEVRADDPLEVHPEVAVVVLVQVAAGGGAGDDHPALLGDVDAGAEGLPAGVLEDDVDVVAAGQLADPLAQALPLLGVLGVLVLPEPVALGGAVDDQLGAHGVADLGLL